MINYKNVLKNILLKEEEKFFHGLSFIITSLIAIHIVIYFNFYKFSSNWIELESKKQHSSLQIILMKRRFLLV